MSESSGLGYGSLRSAFFILGVSVLLFIILFQFFLGAQQSSIVTRRIFRFLWILIILLFSRILLDLIIHGYLDFVGVFPFIEFLFSALIFSRINVHSWINDNIEKVRLVSSVIMIADICFWGYSVIAGVSFGVFRANISGLELNRMADLFYAGVASFMLIDKDSKAIYRSIALLTIFVTLYRSAYLASIVVLAYYLYASRRFVNFKTIFIRLIVTATILAIIIYSIGGYFFTDFSLIDVLLERFMSTFLSEGEVYGEVSKSERLDQIMPLMYALLEHALIGAGFGYYLLGEPIYNYFNYILVALVIMGIPLVVGLLVPVVYLSKKIFPNRAAEVNSATLLVNSLVVYFFVLLNVFPYMIYFPISSVFAFAICYHLWASMSRHNTKNIQISKAY